jgi:hypothetical protein
MRHPSGTVTFIFTNVEGSTNCSASGKGAGVHEGDCHFSFTQAVKGL